MTANGPPPSQVAAGFDLGGQSDGVETLEIEGLSTRTSGDPRYLCLNGVRAREPRRQLVEQTHESATDVPESHQNEVERHAPMPPISTSRS